MKLSDKINKFITHINLIIYVHKRSTFNCKMHKTFIIATATIL